MLMGLGIGALVGWAIPKMIVSVWRRWWVAVIAVLLAVVVLFGVGLLLSVAEAGTSIDRKGGIIAGVLIGGVIAAVWTAIKTVRTKPVPAWVKATKRDWGDGAS
jgi:hypothetical protein